jgi:uncharacterized SAM-binding protein YcdF (DUF218 family)
MFFTASKVIGWLITPLHALIVCLVIGVIALWLRWLRTGRAFVTFATVMILLIGATPLPELALRPLEQWYPAHEPTEAPHGIIVIGGGQNVELTEAYKRPQINDRGETMTEFLALARRFPDAKLVFAGGSGDLVEHKLSEAEVMKRFVAQQGVDTERLILESKSRNTHENALFAKDLVNPKPSERWLLITSAWHMPRSVATFEKAGWPVIPYPADYRVLPTGVDWRVNFVNRFRLFHMAMHEWLGFLVYWVTGRA